MSLASFNSEKFNQIRELFGQDFDKQHAMFLANIESYLDELAAALNENRMSDVEMFAHKIVPSAAAYGAARLYEMADGLQYCTEGNAPTPHIIDEMRKAFALYRQHAARLTAQQESRTIHPPTPIRI